MKEITFKTDQGEETFFLEEETRINGCSYLLVTDSEDDEATAYILKDISKETDEEAEYRFVDDETELKAVAGVFREIMEEDGVELR